MIFFSKSQPAPEGLNAEKAKANGTYRLPEVLARIRNDFNNKCYICEYRGPIVINVEHFIPHRGNVDLKFDWNNLFYCCGHCNNTKSDKAEYDDILNCIIEDDEVDKKIKYGINPLPKEKAIFTAVDNNQRVVNTIDLLNAVYNGTTDLKKMESANLRDQLLKEIRKFNDLLFEYNDNEFDPIAKAHTKNLIESQLRPSSCFTAFKRWIMKECVFADEFADYLT